MSKKQAYTSEDVVVLTDREHVRLRTQVYLGNTHPAEYTIPLLANDSLTTRDVVFIPAVLKALNEILDNSLDEFAHVNSKVKLLKLDASPSTGKYTISDNGRGIPIDLHSTGKHTPEVALSQLKSGRNFTDEKEVGVIGQNGVGSACTNYCSTSFEVNIHRDKKRYYQKFIDGAAKASKPKITSDATAKTGTEIALQLDPVVFADISLPDELVRNRAIEIALTNPDITVEYNGEKFRFRKGFVDYINRIADNADYWTFSINQPHIQAEFFVIPEAFDDDTERMFTWVNSSYLYDGGKCNTQFFNAFFDRMVSTLEPAAKKNKCKITRSDVKSGVAVFANIKIQNPEYDSQSKTRLTGPDLRNEITSMLDADWKAFTKRHDEWINHIIERTIVQVHTKENKQAVKDHQKRKQIDGLLDAVGKDRSKCQLLVTEGDSAKSQISEARDPTTTAAFALRGKINNVYGCTPAQALRMGKIGDLLAAIGLTPGKRAVRSDLNYGRVVISTDADYDGDDIFTLLTNLLFQYWPELFDPAYEPFVFRLVAPNVCLVKGSTRLHFPRRAEYEHVKNKYKGYEVRYYKGLGSMPKADWEMILSGKTDTLIPITDDGEMGNTLKLLFSNDVDARKEWLMEAR
jgi:DNA topoisomerase-2